MYLNVSRLKAGTHDTTYGSDVRHQRRPYVMYRFPRRHRDVIYAPPLVISLSELVWLSSVFRTRSETVELCLECCVTLPTTPHSFGYSLETFFPSVYQCIQHNRGFGDYALYKSTFYLLTYLASYSIGLCT